MNVLDLFSGIGGFSLGLERAGMTTVAFCEIEDYPVSILNKHWPFVPVHRDIRKLDGRPYRDNVDVICGGFPCQPFSVAGQQGGVEDDRHLWPEMLRLIKEIQPAWVIGENVVGIIKLALDDVLSDLEAEGYTTQSIIVPACAVGGLHRRERVWIIAHSEHDGSLATKIGGSESEAVRGSPQRSNGSIESQGICVTQDVADPQRTGLEGYAGHEQDAGKGTQSDRPVSEASVSRDWEPVGEPVESPICDRVDGVPDRVARLKALGNSVVPQIVELIGRAIVSIH